MLTTISVRAHALLAATLTFLVTLLAGRRQAAGRYSVVAARGVTFIEYALLAAIGVFISWLFREQLSEVFTSLLNKLQGGINSNSNTTK